MVRLPTGLIGTTSRVSSRTPPRSLPQQPSVRTLDTHPTHRPNRPAQRDPFPLNSAFWVAVPPPTRGRSQGFCFAWFTSPVSHSDFSHSIPGDFARRLIRPGTQPRRAGPYETSRGNACSFPAVPPAHTLLRPGSPSTSFAPIVQARYHLDLADRFAYLGYGPAIRLKPFRPHLTVGALSCAQGTEYTQAQTRITRQATGADPGGFPNRRSNPITMKPPRLSTSLLPSAPGEALPPPVGYGPRLGPVRLDFHQLGTCAARRTLQDRPTAHDRASRDYHLVFPARPAARRHATPRPTKGGASSTTTGDRGLSRVSSTERSHTCQVLRPRGVR